VTLASLIILIILFFVTSFVGVITGSNSLITVPIMFQFGIDPKIAIATNMFGLTFFSIGGSLPFLKQDTFDRKRLPMLCLLTIFASIIGAVLVGVISTKAMPIIVACSMIFVVIFSLVNGNSKAKKPSISSNHLLILGYSLTFILGIYGGLFSGGYVTMLTACFVAFLGMNFTQAIANTKIINVFSSLVASIIFAWQGLIDYQLGLILAVTMFAAAFIGAKVVTKLNELWLKRIFLATVILLALKTAFDVLFSA
jgi:uncharacterized protein